MESAAALQSWLHDEGGYTYHGDAPIGGLTYPELMTLQLGTVVRGELQSDSINAELAGGSYSDRRKVSHERDIDRRLRKMEVETN